MSQCHTHTLCPKRMRIRLENINHTHCNTTAQLFVHPPRACSVWRTATSSLDTSCSSPPRWRSIWTTWKAAASIPRRRSNWRCPAWSSMPVHIGRDWDSSITSSPVVRQRNPFYFYFLVLFYATGWFKCTLQMIRMVRVYNHVLLYVLTVHLQHPMSYVWIWSLCSRGRAKKKLPAAQSQSVIGGASDKWTHFTKIHAPHFQSNYHMY